VWCGRLEEKRKGGKDRVTLIVPFSACAETSHAQSHRSKEGGREKEKRAALLLGKNFPPIPPATMTSKEPGGRGKEEEKKKENGKKGGAHRGSPRRSRGALHLVPGRD